MDSQVYAGIYRIHSIFVSVSVRPQSHHNPVIYISKYMWKTMQAHTKPSGIPDRWVTSVSLVCWLLPSSLTFVNCAIIVCKRRREVGGAGVHNYPSVLHPTKTILTSLILIFRASLSFCSVLAGAKPTNDGAIWIPRTKEVCRDMYVCQHFKVAAQYTCMNHK